MRALNLEPRYLLRAILLGGLFFMVSTAYVNIGIIALDDYTDIVANIVPAGVKAPRELIADAGIRSPLPTLFLSSLSKTAHRLGFLTPVGQLRFILICLGLFSFLVQVFCAIRLFRLSKTKFSLQERTAAFFLSFYFLTPLFFTRAMIEALAMPYVTLSAFLACDYWVRGKQSSLIFSLFAITAASLFRFQAGVCLLALLLTVCLRQRWKDLGWLAFGGLVAFVATGLLDYSLRGTFHTSLISYTRYNLLSSSSYGVQPFYNFILLFIAMSFPPALFVRYKKFDWRAEYGPFAPLLLYFVVFVVAHSAVPHKEERFILPILGVFLIGLAPLAAYVWENQFRKRITFFLALNFLLLVLTSYNVAQNNVVALGRFLDRHPRIHSVFALGPTLLLEPQAFIGRKIDFRGAGPLELSGEVSCNGVVAARKDLVINAPELTKNFKKVVEFRPGVLEALLVRLNPRQNARRNTIVLFEPKHCT